MCHLLSAVLFADTLLVPEDYPTIQEGINAAVGGDTVLVAPGVYYETPYINNKNFVLASHRILNGDDSFIENTIIDASEISGSPVIFIKNTNSSMVFDGFTIRGGNGYVFFDDSETGSLFLKNSDANVRYLKIHENHYDGFAWTGRILINISGSPKFENILLYDNSSLTGTFWLAAGGGSQFMSVTPVFENVTFGNTSEPENNQGMIIGGNETIVTMTNCIFWNGQDDDGDWAFDSTKLDISFSNIQGGWEGDGNLNTDPLFSDPDNGDFTLEANSPCIDAGDPNSPLDPDGTVADMGAFYFDQTTCVGWELGDPNQDGEINVLDIVETVGCILASCWYEDWCIPWTMDMSGDGSLNILDIVILVNIILEG